MIHIDLFSGIGGFALAVDEVWPGIEHIFCEIDPFCQRILKKHWKGSEIYGDIRQLTADAHRNRLQVKGAELKTGGDRQFSKVDILTGGFPCQPFSQAGKRRGTSDNLFLWPEMLRVIRDFKPTWVIAENVRGLLTIEQGVVFEQVCLDLEGEGYEVQPIIIPAVAVNAPHRRDRVWFIVLHSASNGLRRSKTATDEKGYAEKPGQDGELARGLERTHSNAPDTEETDRHAKCVNVEGVRKQQDGQEQNGLCNRKNEGWEQNWLEVATELCGMDDGLPTRLYFLRGLRYNIQKGGSNEKSDSQEAKPEMDESIWKEMRKVWEEWLSESASRQNGKEKDSDTMRSVPRQRTPKEWHSQSQEAEELCSMWKKFYALPFQEAQKLFTEMLERIRSLERTKKVGSLGLSKAKHRVERLKSLGNAIVPQVAIEIMKAIKYATPKE